MSTAAGACPLCGGAQSALFDRRIVHYRSVINRLCATCGLVYQSPRMTDADLELFYQEEYRRLYQGDQGPTQKDLQVQAQRAGNLTNFTREHIPAVSRHLDIGCSAGLLLQRFREAYGCQPTGVEPGKAYRQYAKDLGLEVFSSLEDLLEQDPARFDLISMAHVLEHLSDPITYLEKLRLNLLGEVGCLLVEVPNLYAHDSFEIAHLVSYSSHTLRQALNKAGYEVLDFQQHGQPRSEIIPLYLTALARPAQYSNSTDSVVPERGVRRKRRLGMLRRRLLSRLFPRKAWHPLSAA